METDPGTDLAIYVKQSLEEFKDRPKLELEAAALVNTAVSRRFDVETFLRDLNEKLFRGKGKVKPLYHRYSLKPDLEEEPASQSRFSRLFHLKGSTGGVSSSSELTVDKYYIKDSSKIQDFDHLSISIKQTANLRQRSYTIWSIGELSFSRLRDMDGNWDGKTIRPTAIGHGRSLYFAFDAVPPVDDISKALLQNMSEILRSLALQGLIPEPQSNEESLVK